FTHWPSQLVLQQNASIPQICVTHGSQPLASAPPCVQMSCAHAPPPHICPQIEVTSFTHWPSQLLLQQNASTPQICVTHGSQPLTSAPPCMQMSCAHAPPPMQPAVS